MRGTRSSTTRLFSTCIWMINLWVKHAQLWISCDLRLFRHRVGHPICLPLLLLIKLFKNLIYFFKWAILCAWEFVMCLALCDMFDVILIRLVAYLAKSMIFVWNWLRLRNRNDAKVVISLNMTLFVFGCLFCPKFFDSCKIVNCIFLLRSCCARAIPIGNITLKSVIVIRLLENASS